MYSRQPFALALAMLSIFLIFIVEIIAFRWGTAKLAAIGMEHGELHRWYVLVRILNDRV